MEAVRALDAIEQRILGSLLEKAQTTPDYYPLTLNALVAACNQKSNREPVMALGEPEVREALESLRDDVLVWRSDGARSVRWSESISRRLDLGDEKRAILTVLLLRGPQTPGELRSRTGRMVDFPSLAAVDDALQEMSAGPDPMVAELHRQAGQKETRWQHLLGTGERYEPERAAASAVGGGSSPDRAALAERVAALEERLQALSEELAALVERLDGR